MGAIKGVCLGHSQGFQAQIETQGYLSGDEQKKLLSELPMVGCVFNELLLSVAQSFNINLKPEFFLQM